MLITHDRDFMDAVVDHIIEITRTKVKKVPGTTKIYYD